MKMFPSASHKTVPISLPGDFIVLAFFVAGLPGAVHCFDKFSCKILITLPCDILMASMIS